MNSTGKSEKASRCPQGRQSARCFSHVASEHCATDRSEVSGVRGRTSKRGFSRASASGRPSIGKEDAHGVLFVPQRPNEEPESKRDVRDRPEDDRFRCARVAVGLKKGERLGKVRGRSCEQRDDGRKEGDENEFGAEKHEGERGKNEKSDGVELEHPKATTSAVRRAGCDGLRSACVGTPGDDPEPPIGVYLTEYNP